MSQPSFIVSLAQNRFEVYRRQIPPWSRRHQPNSSLPVLHDTLPAAGDLEPQHLTRDWQAQKVDVGANEWGKIEQWAVLSA